MGLDNAMTKSVKIVNNISFSIFMKDSLCLKKYRCTKYCFGARFGQIYIQKIGTKSKKNNGV